MMYRKNRRNTHFTEKDLHYLFRDVSADQQTVKLLLCCLGIGTDETEAAMLRKLSVVEWGKVIHCASGHDVYPIICKRLDALGPNIDISSATVQRLRKIYSHSMKRNMQLHDELSNVLKLLHEHDIPVIVLKGAVLGELIYQNIALRPMHDVDLMVKPEDIWRADEALMQSGYRRTMVPLSKRHMQWGLVRRHLVHMKEGVKIETHVRIPELPDFDPWISARPITMNSTDVFMLCPDDLLLYLCVHLDSHTRAGLPRLLWCCDIAMVLKCYQGEFDWDYVTRIAREHQVEGAIQRILHMINEEFHGLVPMDVLTGLKCDNVTISINDVLYPNEELRKKLPPLQLLPLLDFSGIPSVHNKIYHVFRIFFPCREYMMYSFPAARTGLIHLYYPIHIGRETVRIIKAVGTIRSLLQLLMYLKNRHAARKKPDLKPD